MSDMDSSSGLSSGEESEYNTDDELQNAFASQRLKPGVHVLTPFVKRSVKINNVDGLNKQLDTVKLNLEWTERLDMTNAPAPLAPELALRLDVAEADSKDDSLANNDFKREILFYRQAQAAVLEAIPILNTAGIKTKRPDDYFAQMAKSDDHMQKVREQLISKEVSMEQREKARKLRDLRKYGKQVQQEVLQKRQQEKKEMMNSIKKFRKGQKGNLDFLDGSANENGRGKKGAKAGKQFKRNQSNKNFKEKRYGFGGQKKRSKYNDSKSSADVEGFSRKVHQPANPNRQKAGGGKAAFKGQNKRKGQRRRR